MSEPPKTAPTKTELNGASLGGIIGITVWHILSGSLLNVGVVAGCLILTAYMVLCMLLGMMIERVFHETD